MSRNEISRTIIEYAQVLFFLVVLLLVWEAICRYSEVPVWLLPSPTRIWSETLALAPVLPKHTLATLYAIFGGFFLAIIAAIPLAIGVVLSPTLGRIIYPPLLMLQSVPKVAVAPLLLIWLGYGLHSNIVIAATVAFFPIVINTASGLAAVDSELLDLTKSFGSSKLKVFRKVRLPWAMPFFFSSLRVAITLAVIGAVVAEFIGADEGLGYLILASSGNMNTAAMFGVLLIMSALGILCFYAVVACERILCPWYMPTNS